MRWARRRRRDRDEQGYALVVVALSLTVLMTMVGLSLDTGAWYRKANQVQSAVDAAALAGVVHMPGDFAGAQAAATRLLERNGITAANGHEISIARVSGKPFQLRVCAADPHAASIFARLAQANPRIAKCATAETLLPLSMGSPLNVFSKEHLKVWPAVNGFCSALEDGDLRLSRYRANRPNGSTVTCPGAGTDNPHYNQNGYDYIVDLPNGSNAAIQVDIYDGTFWPRSGTRDMRIVSGADMTTVVEVWDENRTPYDDSDDVLESTVTIDPFDSSHSLQWRNLANFPGNRPAGTRYRIRVKSLAGELDSAAVNTFGLRAFRGNAYTFCTSEVGAASYDQYCPSVHGEGEMSIFADGDANPATFYLGSVSAAHAGKTMVVDLFDPGEGAQSVEILDPNGTPFTFDWVTADEFVEYSGSGTVLSTSGTGATLPGRVSNSRFNERIVRLTVTLPSDYTTRYGTKTWWKIRYQTGGSVVTDRTTWSMTIPGSPLRLVPEGSS